MAAEYPYAQGELLDNPQRYTYVPYRGNAFLDAWRLSRDQALQTLPEPVSHMPPPRQTDGAITIQTCNDTELLLERAFAALANKHDAIGWSILERFVKKFEISKRIYSNYLPDWRADTTTDFHKSDLYLRAAELFEAALAGSGDIRYLNVLLKIVDTLIATRDRLSTPQGQRLSRLIFQERTHVAAIITKLAANA